MVRRVVIVFLLFLLVQAAWADGWRKGEMEVKVMVSQASDLQKIRDLGLDFEPATQDGSAVRMYLVADELKLVQKARLAYKITIPDMNRHFEHFWDNPLVPSGYYTYDQIIAIADSLATNFPAICKKVSWGTSVGGRQLAALKISDNVNNDEPEPEIMFDGGIHGDEVGGSQNIILFARDLCLGFGADPAITNLINDREIWLYLMVNPDGRESMSRYNNNGVDCNRDNGYMWNGEGNSWSAFSQVETKALRNLILDNQFVVYTNYHSGTEVLAYPWSYRSNPTRDNEHINQLAGVYSTASGYAYLQYGQGYNIMYAINGSTKDFQYGSLGNIGWSIEISVDKQPASSQISHFYTVNKPAMLELINRCGWGVSGMITDSVSGAPVKASIQVNNYFPIYNDPAIGDYHKYILPGTYTLKVVANGYKPKTIYNVTVPSTGSVVADVQLVPAVNHFAYKVASCRIPGNNFGDEGFTPGALGRPDSIPYSLGRSGWIVLDMGDTIFNGPGNDFKIIQAGTVSKSFTVSAGNNIDGPFTAIGTGTGTTGFDLAAVSINKARYLNIKDNGTGAASGPGAGFNLDAVEMLTIPVSAEFTATSTTPCIGSPVSFTDASAGNPTTWSWSFPGGVPATSTLQNPADIHYDTPGQYTVSLTVSNGITTGSKTKVDFIISSLPPAVTLGNDTSLCEWSSILLDAGNPGSAYLWSTGATTQTIMVDSTGIGYGSRDFRARVTNPTGCAAEDTIKVTFENCTGIRDFNVQHEVSVYPNPSGGYFVMDIRGFKGGTWELSSMQGNVIADGNIPNADYHADMNRRKFPQGLYLLKVNGRDVSAIRKLLVTPSLGK
ncbi:MAG: M14 family zinc carboxypeptidase [Bacteroidales bacterium]